MTTTRDIPFDEEVPERSEEARSAFGFSETLEWLNARRARIAREFDAAVRMVDVDGRNFMDHRREELARRRKP